MLTRIIARQLGRPSGLLGRFVGRKLNRNNHDQNLHAIEQLHLRPGERVLDIGFGGGVSLPPLLDAVDDGLVAGLEVSDTMIARARKRFRNEIEAGRLVLEGGGMERMPFPDDGFDAALTVNTFYFLDEPDRALAEARRVLRAGGRLAVSCRDRESMEGLRTTKYGFTLYDPDRIRSLLEAAGFREIRVDHYEDDPVPWYCAVGRAPTAK